MIHSFARSAALLLTGLLACAPLAAQADDYPSRPIKLIVPFAPGGGSDILARMVGKPLGERLGQTIIIENKPGAGGSVAAAQVAKATPDGYTLMYMTPGVQMINPFLMQVNYDARSGFTPIGMMGVFPNALIVNAKVPVDSVQALIDHARQHPGDLNYGSTGIGSSSHMSGELLRTNAGIDIVHVPYKGTSAVAQDLIAGNIHMTIDAVSTYLPYIRDGSLKALAVGIGSRLDVLPGVPTIGETLPGFDSSALNYLSAPAGTPPDIVARLNRELNAVLASEAVRTQLQTIGVLPMISTPEELQSLIESETAKWRKVIESSGANAS